MTKLTGLKSFPLDRFFRKDFVLGLDLGTSSFRRALLAFRGERRVLARLDSKEGGSPEERLKALVRDIDLKRTKVVVCLNSPETGVRVLTTPPMPRRELQEAVGLEAKHYFPFPLENSLVDFEKLEETVEKGARKLRIRTAVSPRKTVEETLHLLRGVGIQPASVIPSSYAIQKLGEASSASDDKVRCFLDLGERNTELVILKNRNLAFSRKLPVAGRDFTESLTVVLASDRGKVQLSAEEAEAVKREVGIPQGSEAVMIGEKISTSQVLALLRTPLEALVNEIESSFNYYREESGGGRVDSLLLYGGGASLKGLPEALSEALGIEVKVGVPGEGLPHESQVVVPDEGMARYAAAWGTALTLGQGINLLPPEIKEERKRLIQRATIQSAAAATVLLASFFYIGMKIQLSNFEKRIAVAQLERGSLQSELDQVADQGLARKVLAGEPHWEEVLKELSNVLPSEIHLTEMGVRQKRLVLKGVITAREKERFLSDLMSNLDKGIFRNVKLVTTKEKTDRTASEFELEAGFDGGTS